MVTTTDAAMLAYASLRAASGELRAARTGPPAACTTTRVAHPALAIVTTSATPSVAAVPARTWCDGSHERRAAASSAPSARGR
ncbi:hypothetical protein ATL41_2461 [Flavimobilis soli]|uniref:Uncharacterized protein n=1 Tax=Flavimobilis soli TaxID=442709 RepID=A0A2A9EHG5_9MICO|nr:hypothetical protein [Flavimobilis soli]PFG37692.1 hypothetical protein ATL41_2461 [Flavimobilis soli]